jgi:hypothetical protein
MADQKSNPRASGAYVKIIRFFTKGTTRFLTVGANFLLVGGDWPPEAGEDLPDQMPKRSVQRRPPHG